MANRLVTIATFENTTQAHVAKNALHAAGIRAVLGDEMTVDLFWNLSNAIGGVKVQVLDGDAERAVEILEKELGTEEDQKLDENDFATEAESTPSEDAEIERAEPAAVSSTPPARIDAGTAATLAEGVEAPPSDRDWYARGLFIVSWFALGLPPVWPFALYFFLNAAIGTGPISARGRYNLLVGSIVLAAATLCIPVMFFIVWANR